MDLSEDELALLIDERVQNSDHMRGEAYSQLRGLHITIGKALITGDLSQLSQAAELRAGYDRTVTLLAMATRRLVQFGWSPSLFLDSSAIEEALRVADSGGSAADVDAAMVEGLRPSRYLGELSARLTNFAGSVHQATFDDYLERSNLVREAWENHVAGRYASAVALVLTQVEGIVADVTDKMYFSKRASQTADVVDDTTIAGLPDALTAVRQIYIQNVDRTSRDGLLSRHGVLHGRELRFGTEAHSFKAFALLAAIMEWGRPHAAHRAYLLQATVEAANGGLDGIDEEGARRDDRDFTACRAALRDLEQQMNAVGSQLNAEHADALLAERLTHYGSVGPVTHHVVRHRRGWWAWCQTPSSWCLGVGQARADLDERWRWDHPHPPTSGPDAAASLWRTSLDESPNWP